MHSCTVRGSRTCGGIVRSAWRGGRTVRFGRPDWRDRSDRPGEPGRPGEPDRPEIAARPWLMRRRRLMTTSRAEPVRTEGLTWYAVKACPLAVLVMPTVVPNHRPGT